MAPGGGHRSAPMRPGRAAAGPPRTGRDAWARRGRERARAPRVQPAAAGATRPAPGHDGSRPKAPRRRCRPAPGPLCPGPPLPRRDPAGTAMGAEREAGHAVTVGHDPPSGRQVVSLHDGVELARIEGAAPLQRTTTRPPPAPPTRPASPPGSIGRRMGTGHAVRDGVAPSAGRSPTSLSRAGQAFEAIALIAATPLSPKGIEANGPPWQAWAGSRGSGVAAPARTASANASALSCGT